MLKTIIVDDENNAIKTLQSYIHKYVEDVSVVGIAHNKEEAIDLMNSTAFDLVLLDVNLGDGTGFEVLENVNTNNFYVIFTTAYDQHAIKAFKYSALDYLLKPINPEEFKDAIDRLKLITQKHQVKQIAYANQYINTELQNKVVINSSNEIHFLDIKDILRLESDKNYTDIFLTNGQKITSTKTLKFYETLLPDTIFYRIHQKHLINVGFIQKFLKEDGGYILLSDGSKLEVSRRNKEDFLNRLTKQV